MYKKLLFAICVCFVAFLVGCKGDDGEVGPAGPKGDTGATGATGPAGSSGEGGGGALILTTGAVTGAGTEGDLSFGILDELTAAEEAAYDSSIVVMVYAKSLGVWWPLPGMVQFSGTNKVGSFTFVHGVQDATFFVDIFVTDWSETQDTPPTRSFDDIRIVLIPGASGGRLASDVNWKSYDETIKALGLTDTKLTKAKLFKKKL